MPHRIRREKFKISKEMLKTPVLSIIIVNYNTIDLIENCIKSIRDKVKSYSYEIIIIDNCSNDDIDTLKTSKFVPADGIKTIKLSENIGFGRANNEGAKIAKGEYLLFLNPDTLLINDAVSYLIDYIKSNSEIGVCGGNLYDENMKPTRSYRLRAINMFWLMDTLFFANAIEKTKYGTSLFYNASDSSIPVSYVVGADLLIRKKIFNELGGFNPRFFMYYEEVELCHRIWKNGFKVMNVPKAKIQHLEGKSSSNIRFKSFQMFNSAKIYFELTQNRLSYLLSRILYFILTLQRLALYTLHGNKIKKLYWRYQLKYFFNNKLQ